MIVIDMIRGFCMALADSVPGVSGGTVAFLLGFYDQLITSLDNLIRGRRQERLEAIRFLLKILAGWVIGFCAAVLVLTRVFETHIYAVSSLFVGFIVVAVPYVILEERETLRRGKIWHLIFALAGIAVVCAITYFNPVTGGGISVDVSSLNLGRIVYIFVAGMVAISAMILPGISGSTLLLIFGLYVPIINAVKEVLHFHLEYVPVCLVFGLGVIVGILLIIRLLRIALEKFRSQMIWLILGLMLGSLCAIFMGPTTLDDPQPAMNFHTFSIIFFLIGGAVIVGLNLLKKVMENRGGASNGA